MLRYLDRLQASDKDLKIINVCGITASFGVIGYLGIYLGGYIPWIAPIVCLLSKCNGHP